MTPKVSIIVPIYNAAFYIQECIQTVLNQSYYNWELILIDDGSIDESLKICKGYEECDKRIKVVSQGNSGVSKTRNLGVEIASGKYLMFLDADDYWCDNDILAELVNLSEKLSLDVIRGEYKEIDKDGNFLRQSRFINSREVHVGHVLDAYTFYKDIVKKEYFSFLCLYNKRALERIRFNTEKVFLEDAEFYLDLCLRDLKCYYVQRVFYAYRKHPDAVTIKHVPNKFKNAINFTSVCVTKSYVTENIDLRTSYILDGISNFLYDLQVIGQNDNLYNTRKELYVSHNIYNIKKQVVEAVLKNRLYKHFFILLPIDVFVHYYRIKPTAKSMVVSFLRYLKLYE